MYNSPYIWKSYAPIYIIHNTSRVYNWTRNRKANSSGLLHFFHYFNHPQCLLCIIVSRHADERPGPILLARLISEFIVSIMEPVTIISRDTHWDGMLMHSSSSNQLQRNRIAENNFFSERRSPVCLWSVSRNFSNKWTWDDPHANIGVRVNFTYSTEFPHVHLILNKDLWIHHSLL